ncbi:hypothetical protein JL100_036485 (plasmid) [Skermanella mucosa]|uniref:hypothetical protein n=1 Tax=Skermanella mucosa TaxID=1789672 RepID=UPI00192AF7E8|nr:hypothetical protein [Skermanella mucosa]UEM25418.1 hypothetical protein JL100_036485 [Skermanella mucosa]
MADKQGNGEKGQGDQAQRSNFRQRAKDYLMHPDRLPSIGKELAYAVTDIRQKVVEEATYGRVVTPRPMPGQGKAEPGGIHGKAVETDQAEPGGIQGGAAEKDAPEPGGVHGAPDKDKPPGGGIHGAAELEKPSTFRDRCKQLGHDMKWDQPGRDRSGRDAPEPSSGVER